MTQAARALQGHDLLGEVLHVPLLIRDGGPPRMREQLNAGATSETSHTWKTIHTRHTVSPTRRIWNDDYGGQMIFGDLCGPEVSWHLSYRWGKTSRRKPVPTGDRTRARWVTGAHASACSTTLWTVIKFWNIIQNFLTGKVTFYGTMQVSSIYRP